MTPALAAPKLSTLSLKNEVAFAGELKVRLKLEADSLVICSRRVSKRPPPRRSAVERPHFQGLTAADSGKSALTIFR